MSDQQELYNPNLSKRKKGEEPIPQTLDSIGAPPGYIEFKPSTLGLIGCPPLIHIRNFSTEDLMNLGLADDNDRIIRLMKMLQSVIFEQDVRVEYFHEKEVVELLLWIYEAFYTKVFANQPWTLTEEDDDWLADQFGGRDSEEYKERIRALQTEKWKPVFDIDLTKDLQYWSITPETFKGKVRIQKDDFSCVFSLPRFGDVLILKNYIERRYAEMDRRFASIEQTLKFKKEAEDKWYRGENVNLRSIPQVPQTELDKYKEYSVEKSLFAITASKALHLVEFCGQDVSNTNLDERLKLAADPRMDHATFKQVDDYFKELKFGIKEEITVRDPIIGKVVTRKYNFQLDSIIKAYHDTRPDKVVLTFE